MKPFRLLLLVAALSNGDQTSPQLQARETRVDPGIVKPNLTPIFIEIFPDLKAPSPRPQTGSSTWESPIQAGLPNGETANSKLTQTPTPTSE
jgi:hypothetical protein